MTAKEKLSKLLDYKDKNGKQLRYDPDTSKVFLNIDGHDKCLGTIMIFATSIHYIKWDDETSIFRKTNSWSINETILKHVDEVTIETETKYYTITKQVALEYGSYLHFSDTTELKIYIPLDHWTITNKHQDDVTRRGESLVGPSWYSVLKSTIDSDLMRNISKFVKERRAVTTVYPEPSRVFRAFKMTAFNHVKVVLVGQDPYYDGSADGLAFSFLHGSNKQITKSLHIIYDEVQRSCYQGFHLDYDFDLSNWAAQGVLLLNSILTVDKGKANSHKDIGWERFTKIVLSKLMYDGNPKVFLIWGKHAKLIMEEVVNVHKTKPDSQYKTHLLLYAPHPAADLYKRDNIGVIKPNYPETFSGCDHFQQANGFLSIHGRKEIKW